MPKFFTKTTSPQTEIPELPPLQSSESPKVENPEPEEIPFTGPVLGTEAPLIKTYLSWRAPSRPFRKKDRSYYTTTAILITLLILIALLAKEILLIGVLLAFAFVIYVLGFTPPEEVEYKISTQGITIGDHFYFWAHLDSFWISDQEGHRILHVLTHLRFPGELMLVLGSTDEEEIKRVIVKHLPYQEIPPKSLMDNWAGLLQKHFPLENPHK